MTEAGQRQADLEAYCARIEFTGERTPTLETLRAIHARHAESIPYENLNPLLKWPVRLDPPSLMQKMVREGRGGYCHEQNSLFCYVLESLGFSVSGLAARVMWMVPEGTIRPRGHMLLRVVVEGETYLADVGFGNVTLTAPLQLEVGFEQATSHERFRLTGAEDGFTVLAMVRGEWQALYRFGMEPYYRPDYEVMNWYTSTHPESRFVNGLLAGRPAAGRRYVLWNNNFAIHTIGGPTERRLISDAAELGEILTEHFRIRLPEGSEMDQLLHRLAAMPAENR